LTTFSFLSTIYFRKEEVSEVKARKVIDASKESSSLRRLITDRGRR